MVVAVTTPPPSRMCRPEFHEAEETAIRNGRLDAPMPVVGLAAESAAVGNGRATALVAMSSWVDEMAATRLGNVASAVACGWVSVAVAAAVRDGRVTAAVATGGSVFSALLEDVRDGRVAAAVAVNVCVAVAALASAGSVAAAVATGSMWAAEAAVRDGRTAAPVALIVWVAVAAAVSAGRAGEALAIGPDDVYVNVRAGWTPASASSDEENRVKLEVDEGGALPVRCVEVAMTSRRLPPALASMAARSAGWLVKVRRESSTMSSESSDARSVIPARSPPGTKSSANAMLVPQSCS
jgi:hypothetical protein